MGEQKKRVGAGARGELAGSPVLPSPGPLGGGTVEPAGRPHSPLYGWQTGTRCSKAGFVVTVLEARLQPSSPCPAAAPAAASWSFSGLLTTAMCIASCEHHPWVKPLGSRHRQHGGGRLGRSGAQSRAALGPAATPVPEAPGCGRVGGCPHIHKARGNQPGTANRLSKHCW